MDSEVPSVRAAPVPGPSTSSALPRAVSMLPPIALPTTSTFSFTAPYPASVSQPPSHPQYKLPTSTSTPTSPTSSKGQRRVSLALPSSPRQFPAWSFRDDTTLRVGNTSHDGANSALLPEKKGKIRRISDDSDIGSASERAPTLLGLTAVSQTTSAVSAPPMGGSSAPVEASGSNSTASSATSPQSTDPPKKARKKWTLEETQMLVRGCNKWGVGNWKAILNDPDLKFDNRSPVDLKDRFRTYFPDAYKIHYPNAKTHLPSATASANRSSNSSKSRSMLPDGSPLFLQSRQKKRRPFTPEEDRALKEGYDKHGTVWATIVKDPIFKEQGRRSTDLRDRFRNAWPELYAKAGYKPRANASKKKRLDLDPEENGQGPDGRPTREPNGASNDTTSGALSSSAERIRTQPVRAATDDQLPTAVASNVGPVRRKRRHTTQGFGLYRGGTKSSPESMANSEDEASESELDWDGQFDDCAQPSGPSIPSSTSPVAIGAENADIDMDVAGQDQSVPDFVSTSSLSISDLTDSSSQAHTSWSELDTPLHPWSATPASTSQQGGQSQSQSTSANMTFNDSLAASPTSTDYFLPNSPSAQTSTGMIGKSAWGPQDWLSPNPRLESSSDSFSNSLFSPSPIGSPSLFSSSTAPSQPMSLAQLSFSHLALASSSGSQSNSFSHGHSSHVHSQAYSHGVMDRYDLFPPSSHLHHGMDDFDVDTFDLDFISEGLDAASSDVHSAFSDPSSAWAPGTRRGGFTHHSNYAGDLIFGARTHQPSGHLAGMDYGPGFGFGALGTGAAMGLGLEGAQQSVLHTPALPGIDEIELTSISLNDPLPSEKDDIPMALEEVVNANMVSSPPPPDASNPGSDAPDAYQSLSLDDIVGIPPESESGSSQLHAAEEHDTSHHTTPPATPANAFRASTRAQTGFSLQHRSVSVPPSEHRAFQPPPRPGQSQVTSPKAKYKSLMMTPTRATFAVPQLPASSTHVGSPTSSMPAPPISQPQPPPAPTLAPHAWPPADAEINDLPFLDLHYFSSNDFLSMSDAFSAGSLQLGAQALDLAQTLAPAPSHAPASHHKQMCVAPALVQPMLAGETFKPVHSHHRGQSATAVVSPQDLFVRRGNDNKRKRASWDGGPK